MISQKGFKSRSCHHTDATSSILFFLKLVDPKSCFEANTWASFPKGLRTPCKTTACQVTLAGLTGKPTAMPSAINKLQQCSTPARCVGAHGLFLLPAGSPSASQGLCTPFEPAQGEGRWHGAATQHNSAAGSQGPPRQPSPRKPHQIIPPLPGIPLPWHWDFCTTTSA